MLEPAKTLCMHLRTFPLLLVAGMVATGCGRPRYAVEGQASYSGGEAYTAQGFVIAEATIDGTPVSARGVIGPDGRFRLSGRSEHDGVMAGTYRVRLVAPRGAGDIDAGGTSPLPFDRKFLQFDTSGLELDVGRQTGPYEIDVGAKPGS